MLDNNQKTKDPFDWRWFSLKCQMGTYAALVVGLPLFLIAKCENNRRRFNAPLSEQLGHNGFKEYRDVRYKLKNPTLITIKSIARGHPSLYHAYLNEFLLRYSTSEDFSARKEVDSYTLTSPCVVPLERCADLFLMVNHPGYEDQDKSKFINICNALAVMGVAKGAVSNDYYTFRNAVWSYNENPGSQTAYYNLARGLNGGLIRSEAVAQAAELVFETDKSRETATCWPREEYLYSQDSDNWHINNSSYLEKHY